MENNDFKRFKTVLFSAPPFCAKTAQAAGCPARSGPAGARYGRELTGVPATVKVRLFSYENEGECSCNATMASPAAFLQGGEVPGFLRTTIVSPDDRTGSVHIFPDVREAEGSGCSENYFQPLIIPDLFS